jgi:triacylglycerol lipase
MLVMIVPRLRAPIVLVHGLFGFDRLQVGAWVLAHYFHGIPERLSACGNRVLVARLSPTAGIANRAAQLKAFLDREVRGEPVHLFAHSMGGLDSRYMISHLGMAPRVLSLTTLGTPHRGSPFADWGVGRFRRLLQPLLEYFGLPCQAFDDLTVARCRDFNEATPDDPGVRYFSVAGRFAPTWWSPEWQLPAAILHRTEGPNDAVVSVESARWGESCEVWDDGHHLNLINWHACRPHRDRTEDYARLVCRLADAGY